MNTKTVGIALVLVLLLLGLALRGQQETATIGRFQIIAGVRTVQLPNAGEVKEPTVFKVDTATGQAWHFIVGMNKEGKNYHYWDPIDQK